MVLDSLNLLKIFYILYLLEQQLYNIKYTTRKESGVAGKRRNFFMADNHIFEYGLKPSASVGNGYCSIHGLSKNGISKAVGGRAYGMALFILRKILAKKTARFCCQGYTDKRFLLFK